MKINSRKFLNTKCASLFHLYLVALSCPWWSDQTESIRRNPRERKNEIVSKTSQCVGMHANPYIPVNNGSDRRSSYVTNEAWTVKNKQEVVLNKDMYGKTTLSWMQSTILLTFTYDNQQQQNNSWISKDFMLFVLTWSRKLAPESIKNLARSTWPCSMLLCNGV